MRIAIIGSTGAGKTTLARALAGRFGVRHVELDALHWEPGWVEAPNAVFRQRAAAALTADGWVVDGNYRVVRDLVWECADLIVWLDYAFPRVLWQLTRRTMRRCLRREVLWNGNRERLSTHLFTRDSLFLWLLGTHWRRRREFASLLRRPEYAHARIARLRSPAAMRAWLASLPV